MVELFGQFRADHILDSNHFLTAMSFDMTLLQSGTLQFARNAYAYRINDFIDRCTHVFVIQKRSPYEVFHLTATTCCEAHS